MEEDTRHSLRSEILILAVVFVAVLLIVFAAIPFFVSENESTQSPETVVIEDNPVLKQTVDLLSQNFVEPVDEDEIRRNALPNINRLVEWDVPPEDFDARGAEFITDTLKDPFTTYMSERELSIMTTQLEGHFFGVGIVVREVKSGVVIDQVLDGTPGAAAGLREGDIVEEVDGVVIEGMDVYEAVLLIRGEEGTVVNLRVRRGADPDLMEFNVERGDIQLQMVESKMLEPSIGYIKLNGWIQDMTSGVREALDGLKEEGAEAFIVDLRGNSGGYMQVSINVADLFLKEGIIVSSKGRVEGSSQIYTAIEDMDYDEHVVILTNRGSASASEIFAGALRDNKRAVIVGETTFGKGSLQKVYNLTNGGGIKITVGRYFTPSGINIDDEGIRPDIISKSDFMETEDVQLNRAKEVASRLLSGENILDFIN